MQVFELVKESKRAASLHDLAEAEQAKLTLGLGPLGSFDGSGECFCRALLHRGSDITQAPLSAFAWLQACIHPL